MRKRLKSDFEKMCDELYEMEKYPTGKYINEIKIAKKRVRAYSRKDRDNLLKLKVQANGYDFNNSISLAMVTVAMVISGVGTIYSMLPKLNVYLNTIILISYLGAIMVVLCKILKSLHTSVPTSVLRWRGCILVAIEELEKTM